MTPFRTARLRIGWPIPHVAGRLRMSLRQTERWDSGDSPAPDRVVAWLERVVDAVDAVPVPPKPETGE